MRLVVISYTLNVYPKRRLIKKITQVNRENSSRLIVGYQCKTKQKHKTKNKLETKKHQQNFKNLPSRSLSENLASRQQ